MKSYYRLSLANVLTTALLVFQPLELAAEPSNAQNFAGRSEMEGYSLSNYEGFQKNWHAVTVRFRKDTGEMRFVYANDLAWEALKKGGRDYPDGAVFAKIGIATSDDPAFASSAVPSGVTRYQLMVRNKKKHSDTDGWGYALFDAKGLTFPEDPKVTVKACAACHRLVPERSFVFAEILELASFKFAVDGKSVAKQLPVGERIRFRDAEVKELPIVVRNELPASTKRVRLLLGEMAKNLFQGTLDEIRPTLAGEAIRSGLPALLMSEKKDRYSLVYPDEQHGCADKKTVGLKGKHNIYFKAQEKFEISFCHSKE